MIIIAGLVILIAAVVAEVAGVEFIDCRGLRALAGAAAPSAPGGAEHKVRSDDIRRSVSKRKAAGETSRRVWTTPCCRSRRARSCSARI